MMPLEFPSPYLPQRETGLAEPQNTKTLHLKLRHSPPLGPPFSILSLEDGSYLLSDEFNHRILRFDPQGELIWQLGGKGNALGKFWYPRGMTRIGSELYICDSWNHRIQVIDLGAHAVRSLGGEESGEIRFDECSDLMVDSADRLWVADTGNHCLKIISPEGNLLQTIGRRLSKAEESTLLQNPACGLDLHHRPGFCYPRRFLSRYPFGFCLEDRGNDRLLFLSDQGNLYGEIHTETGQILLQPSGFSPQWAQAAFLPVPFMKGHHLKVINWHGAPYLEAEVARFSEIQGQLQQEENGRMAFVMYTFDWSTQDIFQYRIFLPDQDGSYSPSRYLAEQ